MVCREREASAWDLLQLAWGSRAGARQGSDDCFAPPPRCQVRSPSPDRALLDDEVRRGLPVHRRSVRLEQGLGD